MAPTPTSSLIATATSTLPATLVATATSTFSAVTVSPESTQWFQTKAFIYTMGVVGTIVILLGGIVVVGLIHGTPNAPAHVPKRSGKLKWHRWVWGFNKEDYPSTIPPESRR
ncbi:hypothetical protein HDU96_001637 [Phlyctochytrium bullatum]|nr:hypothetical protein HDU96_001637 [Phlyctochytrium bullatum]